MDQTELLEKIRTSRKYRNMDLPDETILDLIDQAGKEGLTGREIDKCVKEKLHNIVADYLGDVDYANTLKYLQDTFRDNNTHQIKHVCQQILSQHQTTRERLPYYESFFDFIIEICGNPRTILDLACGFNPIALPYSHIPVTTCYHAYDIHKARIDLINHFFLLSGRQALAECRDVLVRTPNVRADAVFLLLEAHRMEKRRKGSSAELIREVHAEYYFISFPSRSLNGRHDLRESMRHLLMRLISDDFDLLEERIFSNEMIFCVKKKNG